MKKIYFDTNIYNDIYTKSQYFQNVKNDIDSNKYQLYFSPITFWEIISNPDTSKAIDMIDMIKKLNPIFLKSPDECLALIYLKIIEQFDKNLKININLVDDFIATEDNIWYTNFKDINNVNISNIVPKANKESTKTKKQQMCREYIYATFYSRLITELVLHENIEKGYLIKNFFIIDIQNKFSSTLSDIKSQKLNIDNNLKKFYATNFKDKCKILNILKEDLSYIEIRSEINKLNKDISLINLMKKFYSCPVSIIDSILINEKKLEHFTSNDFLIFRSKVITETVLSILSEKRHPKITEGDFFDWEQLIYSKIIDIFFTKDKRFYKTINKTNYNTSKFIYLDSYDKYKTV